MKNGGLCSLIIMILFSSATFAVIENETPISVTRRLSRDIYHFNGSMHMTCQLQHTFLVSERICVKDQELISGIYHNDCNFAISSIEELLNCRTVLTIDHRNQTNFLTVHTSNDTITTFTDALVIVINDSCQPASSPFCEISNLEVYRGHDQLVGISHEGLSLSDKGAIKINYSRLAYNINEFEGEVYRMSISCSEAQEMFPESGCLFFKVVGTTDVTNAKFDHSVQGTLDDRDTHSTVSDTYWSTVPTAFLTTNYYNYTTIFGTTTSTVIFGSHLIVIGSTLFYIVVGAGSGVLVLLLIVLIMCVAVCYLAAERGKSYTITTESADTMYLHGTDTGGGRENPEQQGQSSRHNVTNEDRNKREHMYAEIRASSPSPPPLPPPLITDELIYYEEKTMTEGNYQSNINIPSHLKWPSKRVIRAAELAYLYERHSDEFELPFYPKRAGVTDVVDSLYDDPTCLSLTPAPGILRVQDSNQNAIQGCDGEAETKLSLSYPNRTHQETALL